MPTCKGCGREYHYCSSCDYNEWLSAGYCNAACYLTSGTGKTVYAFIKTLVDGIPDGLFALFDYMFVGEDDSGRYPDPKLSSIPDGEEFFEEYVKLRRMGHKEFCAEKLQAELKRIEDKKRMDEEAEQRKTVYFLYPKDERELYLKLKKKYEGDDAS
jgi:hypothetical protein